jgi:hypothetical protein
VVATTPAASGSTTTTTTSRNHSSYRAHGQGSLDIERPFSFAVVLALGVRGVTANASTAMSAGYYGHHHEISGIPAQEIGVRLDLHRSVSVRSTGSESFEFKHRDEARFSDSNDSDPVDLSHPFSRVSARPMAICTRSCLPATELGAWNSKQLANYPRHVL